MVFNTWSLIAMLGIDSISMLVYGCFGSLNSIDAVDTSAILPAYITATLLHTSATILMLCVINIIDSWYFSFSLLISSSIWASTITSRDVVGSSAIINDGSRAKARPIITLCLIPPLN